MFWFRQSQVKMIQDQMKRIQAARLAMAESTDYERILNDLDSQTREVEQGKRKVVEDNWEFLRSRGKG